MKMYKVELTKSSDMSFMVDEESVQILNMFQPMMNTVYNPASIVGDGNCLYRAVSCALTGSQNYHELLRLYTAIELINHRYCYATEKPHNDFLNDCRIVTSPYDKIVVDTLKVNTYSEMAHIYALSAAIYEPIQTYFPPQLKPELSSAFTRTVVSRGVTRYLSPQVMIMRSSVKASKSMATYQANHFVPLLSKELQSQMDPPDSSNSDNIPESDDAKTGSDRENTQISDNRNYDDYPLYDGDSFGTGYGCETLDAPVTLLDINLNGLVSGSPVDSLPSPESNSDGLAKSVDSVDIEPSIDTGCSDQSAEDGSTEQSGGSDMHGMLDSGFLDIGKCIGHLLKDVPGLARIPPGSKENVYFLLDNKVNMEKK